MELAGQTVPLDTVYIYLFKPLPTVTLLQSNKYRKRSIMTALLLCFSLLLAAVQFSAVDSALPCNSPLRKYLPQQFTHCPSCSYGQWSAWTRSTPPQVRTNQTCDSGKARKYERSRTAVAGSTCTPDPDTEYKYECKELQTSMDWISIRCLVFFL